MKKLPKNQPEFKPRLNSKETDTLVNRVPGTVGTVEKTDKEKVEEKLANKSLENLQAKVDVMNPAFDPDIPEQKQRWLR